MQKKKPNQKLIIAITIVALLLIILLSQTIIQTQNKKRLALLENTLDETVEVKPNIPVVSAGMIPVKLDGEQWVITTKDDTDWYDYENGKPAYIMLNDGYYKSELERGVEDEQLMQNNVGVGVPDDPSVRGTIFVWIPRFAISENGEDIKYISGIEEAEDGWTVPDIFAYRQAETMPDFILTGAWVAVNTDENYTTTINNMTGEDNTYGFIANTMAKVNTQIWQNYINTYIQKLIVGGETKVRPPISDLTNPNRIILRIINSNNMTPIKAKATLNASTMKVTINVTYTKCEIAKIEDAKGNILSENSNTAVDTNITCNDTYYYTITDKLGNTKRANVQVNIITTLIYDVNGGTTTVANTTAGYGDTIEMPTPKRSYTVRYVTNNGQTLENEIVEYTFDGWYTAKIGGEKREYTEMPAKNEKLYAHWTATSITLPILTSESAFYGFDGWYSNSELTVSVGAGGATYTPTSNITLYGKWNTPTSYYGAAVTNYSPGGFSSWRIFHIDDDNIYLIASDYVHNSYLPTSTAGNSLRKNDSYKAFFIDIVKDYTGSEWIRANTDKNAQKWLSFVNSYPSSTNNNIKAVAYMMDTKQWSKFVDGTYAEYAIGGPTLELYCASYKVTHPDKYVECTVASDKGYQVKWSTSSSWTTSLSGLTKNDFNKIYINSSNSSAYGYWLASPSAYDANNLMLTGYNGYVGRDNYYSITYGFRPLVCLKSGVKLVSNGDGTYKIQ